MRYFWYILILVLAVIAWNIFMETRLNRYEEELTEAQELIEELIRENEFLQKESELLREHNSVLQRKLDELSESLQILEELEISTALITNYAPMDDNAIEGMCYQGDPTVTASGARVEIGRTIAADPSIPFGTQVWVQGYGWREVHDRGGAIKDTEEYRRFDVAIHSRQEALRRGPHERLVIIDWR